MADTLVSNLAADVEGKTLLLAETAAQQVTGDLIPVGSAQVGWIRRATVTLTNAEIKALTSTPIEIVAAPASGYRNILIGAHLYLDATAGAYTNVTAGADGWLVIDSQGYFQSASLANSASPTLTGLTDFLTNAAKVVAYLPGFSFAIETAAWGMTGQIVPYASVNATALTISATNTGGPFTDGNAANSLKVIAYYTVEAL